MAFCCAKCQCPQERVERYGGAISTGAEGDYHHRHCCHNISQVEVSENWIPPLQNLQDAMQNKLYEAMEEEEDYPAPEPKIENSRVVANRARKNTETQRLILLSEVLHVKITQVLTRMPKVQQVPKDSFCPALLSSFKTFKLGNLNILCTT
jgi:hypothetical protein